MMRKNMEQIITLKSVSKTFILPHEKRDTLKENVLKVFKKRTYESFMALRDVTLDIQKGDFFGIVGKNGSGKSTLLKIIAGIYAPTSGIVKVEGSIAPFLELGVGFQEDLTGRENIFINATLLGLNKKEIKQKFADMVDFAEVPNFLDLKIKNYSSGMRARLAFAIAKEADADIYLCDEILAVGDERFQQKCFNVFWEWKRQGKTIVLVSHNAALISEFCNRAVLLEDGKIIKKGTGDDVLAEYRRRITPGQDRVQTDFSGSDLRITDVRFYTENGEEKNSFATGDTIVARIFFRSGKRVLNPVFGIALHRGDGTHISGPNTRTSLYPIKEVSKNGYIDCIIERNSLLAGSYSFSASCFDYSCTYPYDYLDKKFRFTIIRNRDNQYGLVELPVTWKINN